MNNENANYLLGILKKKKNKDKTKKNENESSNSSSNTTNQSNVLIQQLMQIQKNVKNEEENKEMIEERVNKMENQKNENQQKSFKNILLRVIQKLEDDVDVVSEKIQEFNEEKKSIVEMNQKEIKRLKTLVRKLYKTILTIYESLDVNKNTRVQLLQRLKQNIESNKNFLQNIQEINMIRGYVPNKMKNMNETEEVKVAEVIEPSEEEEVVMANTNVVNTSSNTKNKSNLTIFNLIEKNKPSENKPTESVVEEHETSSETPSETESEKEPKEMKEKRLNMSKKVSRKLDEMPSITNQQARNSLNQFIRQRMGSSNSSPRMNTPSVNTSPNATPKNNSSVNTSTTSQNITSNVNTTQSNANKKKNNANIFI